MTKPVNLLKSFGLVLMILVGSVGCASTAAPSSNASTSKSTSVAGTPDQAAKSISTAKVGTDLRLVPFNYNLYDPQKDGYIFTQEANAITFNPVPGRLPQEGFKYEGLRLAFENRAQSVYLDDTPLSTDGAVVETQDGQTFPAYFFGGQTATGSPLLPLDHILGSGLPLPPGFRTIGTGDFYSAAADLKNYNATTQGISVICRVPINARVTQIRVPNLPYIIDISGGSSSLIEIPTSLSPSVFATISSLKGSQLLNQPGGITVTSQGKSVNWEAGSNNTRYGGFLYDVVNSDKSSERSATLALPTVVAYYSNGRIQIAGPGSLSSGKIGNTANFTKSTNTEISFSLGPGLTDVFSIPFCDWNNGIKPVYLMLVPAGTAISQGMATPLIYRAEFDQMVTTAAGQDQSPPPVTTTSNSGTNQDEQLIEKARQVALNKPQPEDYTTGLLYAQARGLDVKARGNGGAYNILYRGNDAKIVNNVPASTLKDDIRPLQNLRNLTTLLKPGDFIVWQKGVAGADPNYGHIAVVESVGADYVVVSQSGWAPAWKVLRSADLIFGVYGYPFGLP